MKTNSKVYRLLGAVLMMIITVGCANRTTTQTQTLAGTKWQVIQLQGEPMQPTAEKFILNFGDDNSVSGEGSCNKFFATYKSDDTISLSFSNLGSTRMLCPDMKGEAQFFTALDSTTGYSIEGRKLTLFEGEKSLVVLQRAD